MFSRIIISLSYTLIATVALPVPEFDFHGLDLNALSLFKSASLPAPLYTEPIFKSYPEPVYQAPIIKESIMPAEIYAPSAPILKAPIFNHAPIYLPAPTIVKEAAPVYAPTAFYKAAAVPVVKAVAPVVKAVAPATSYASVTKYHISHAPVLKAVVPAAPVLKTISYEHSYGYH